MTARELLTHPAAIVAGAIALASAGCHAIDWLDVHLVGRQQVLRADGYTDTVRHWRGLRSALADLRDNTQEPKR